MKQTIRHIVLFAGMIGFTYSSEGKNYFADGYHGGIYGHYPVAWKTQFIVDNMTRNPKWKLGLEIEPETWDSVRARTPEAYAAFCDLMTSGRMDYTNPTYAQPYCYNISGESLIRQFQYGIEKLQQHFPGITFAAYSSEEPCFTSCLPAILDGFGFKYISLKCPDTCWGGYMAPMGGEFIMLEGPDGTRLAAVPRYDAEELEANTVWQTTGWRESREYLDACRRQGIKNPVAMCYQDAGWRNGPWIGENPKMSEYTLWKDYFEQHLPESGVPVKKFSQDDVRASLMWGSQVLQKLAQDVRKAENALVSAEKINAIAGVVDPSFVPDEATFRECWRRLLLSQHHDCWIVPYNKLWKFGTWADAVNLWTSGAVSDAQSQVVAAASRVNPGEEKMIKVFNTSLHPREEIVEMEIPADFAPGESSIILQDDNNNAIEAYIINTDKEKENKVKRLVFKATVPPLGYRSYKLGFTTVKNQIDSENLVSKKVCNKVSKNVSNDCVRLVNNVIELSLDLTQGGTVNSLKLPASGNLEYISADSDYSFGELRGFFYKEGRFRSSKENVARVVDFIDTPLLQSVTIEGEIAGNKFQQRYTIRENDPKIDCNLKIFWNGNPGIGEYRQENWRDDRRGFNDDRYKLCYLMPTSFDQKRLHKDAPFDVCESDQEANYYNRWSEIKNNILLDWIDLSESDNGQGIGLISDHTCSFVYGPDYPTGLTLQYSGPGLWGMDYKITATLDVNFSLVPHVGIEGVNVMTDETERFNAPLTAILCNGSGRPDSGSVAEADQPGVLLSAFVKNPDGSLTMRLHNVYAERPANLNLKLKHHNIYDADLSGHHLEDLKSEGGIYPVAINKNGLRTLMIE